MTFLSCEHNSHSPFKDLLNNVYFFHQHFGLRKTQHMFKLKNKTVFFKQLFLSSHFCSQSNIPIEPKGFVWNTVYGLLFLPVRECTLTYVHRLDRNMVVFSAKKLVIAVNLDGWEVYEAGMPHSFLRLCRWHQPQWQKLDAICC